MLELSDDTSHGRRLRFGVFQLCLESRSQLLPGLQLCSQFLDQDG
jgi:hypothetical protein